jgi:hypothetical protein
MHDLAAEPLAELAPAGQLPVSADRDTPGLPLSTMLIGDLFAPHFAGETKFRCLGSVMLVDGLLQEVDLSLVLGGFVDPWNTMLTADEVTAIRTAALPAPDPRILLARIEDDTFVVYSEFGEANLRQYLLVHDPGLAEKLPELRRVPASSLRPAQSENSVMTLTLVVFALVLLASAVSFALTR